MPLFADHVPLTDWTIPWNAVGPFAVDSWDTSCRRSEGTFFKAHRVVGEHGFQLHTSGGAVLQSDLEYAQRLADAANAGELARDPEVRR
jgi:hypothetical protein